MKKAVFFVILPILFIQFLAFAPATPIAKADGPTDISNQQGFSDSEIPTAFGSTNKPTDITTIVSNIIKIVLGLLGIIFVVLIVYAGFRWMTSSGNEDQIDSAKKQIVSAIIGLIIILSAYGITLFIVKAIANATNGSIY